MGKPGLKASMATKCVDQMPAPVLSPVIASQATRRYWRSRLEAYVSRTRIDPKRSEGRQTANDCGEQHQAEIVPGDDARQDTKHGATPKPTLSRGYHKMVKRLLSRGVQG